MKIEVRDGDEKASQYLLLAWETPKEQEFISKLRTWWNEQDR